MFISKDQLERVLKLQEKQFKINADLIKVNEILVHKINALITTHPNRQMFEAELRKRKEETK